jgi:hypothetical protein
VNRSLEASTHVGITHRRSPLNGVTMRTIVAVCAAAAALSASQCNAFYLPGVAPRAYVKVATLSLLLSPAHTACCQPLLALSTVLSFHRSAGSSLPSSAHSPAHRTRSDFITLWIGSVCWGSIVMIEFLTPRDTLQRGFRPTTPTGRAASAAGQPSRLDRVDHPI